METSKILMAFPLIAAFMLQPAKTVSYGPISTTPEASPGVAVVELFTSEGCSSCPPADNALSDLMAGSVKDSRPIYALSFHVDYWNRLGWKDPFSSDAWSNRQRTYSARTGDEVYTPQCVVNGTMSFVGSDREKLDRSVTTALALASTVTVTATVERSGTTATVHYVASGTSKGDELNIALVESGLTNEVKAGENRGRTLVHTHVVRSMRTLSLANVTGSSTIDLNALNDTRNGMVVLFAQGHEQGPVLGATVVKLP